MLKLTPPFFLKCKIRKSGEGHGNPLQYSCLENPMDRGTWRATWGRKELDMTEPLTHKIGNLPSLHVKLGNTVW